MSELDDTIKPQEGQILFYTNGIGNIKLDVLFSGETAWLTQKKMAELFEVDRSVITKHLRNIFLEGELEEKAVSAIFAHTAVDGKHYKTKFYNLDAIISVGYRVNSAQATRFRIWATNTLREYIIKGFVLDDERLKNGRHFGKDYFDELLERIREIRASERRFYQKITDIYAECSIDYDPNGEITRIFYATVQNKLHWAITRQTAAEIIASRADANKQNMGLTTWRHSPNGKILKSDVSIAKNYLSERELTELNRIVNMYLDYAELQATRQIAMNMRNWVERLDAFLQFNDYDVLQDAGRISAEVAKSLAEKEYKQYRIEQDKSYESDFDKVIKKYIGEKEGQ